MIDDNIKVDKNKYVYTIFFHPSMLLKSTTLLLENFLFLKLCTGYIESYIWYDYDYENNCYGLKITGKSLTNILCTRFEIINHFLKPNRK